MSPRDRNAPLASLSSPPSLWRPASDTIHALVQAGVVLNELKSDPDARADWRALLAEGRAAATRSEAESLLARAPRHGAIRQAAAAVSAKKAELFGERDARQLTPELQDKYAALVELERVLAGIDVETLAVTPELASWLVDEALPVLARVALTVTDLLTPPKIVERTF